MGFSLAVSRGGALVCGACAMAVCSGCAVAACTGGGGETGVPLTECAPGSAAGLAFNLPLGAWALRTGTTEAVSCTCFAVLLLGPGATADICAGGVVAVAAGGGVVAVAAGVAEVLELPDWTASA